MDKPRHTSQRRQRGGVRETLTRFGAGTLTLIKALLRDKLTVALLAAAIALLILWGSLVGSLGPSGRGQRVSISEITSMAKGHELTSATLLDHDHQAVVRTDTGAQLYAFYLADGSTSEDLQTTLENGGAQVTVNPQSGKTTRTWAIQALLPILILVVLFAFFQRLLRDGSAGIEAFSLFRGKSRKKRKGDPDAITFDDVAGAPEAVASLRQIVNFLTAPGKYLAVGAKVPKGVLLSGPPGTGKTLLARALAGEAGVPFLTASGSEFVESLVGVGAARVRDLFAKAAALAAKYGGAIVFIDEFDAAGRLRGAGVGQGNDEREQTLNQLLVEMDGFGRNSGVIVIGATNRPDILDDALLRPGRFDRQIVVDRPDINGRKQILELYAKGRQFDLDVDLDQIARMTPGLVGAQLAGIMNEAALLSVNKGYSMIDQTMLEDGIRLVVEGPETAHVLSLEEQRTIAIHEVGHAVVARATNQTIATQSISTVARGTRLGTAHYMLTDRDAVLHTQSSLERQLVSIIAGTAAEQLVFGERSTGASEDLHAATELAKKMITSYGMSPLLEDITIGEHSDNPFLGAALQDLGSIGPGTLDIIDQEVKRIVHEAKYRAEHVLGENRDIVERVATVLIERESLSGADLDDALHGVRLIELDDIELPDREGPRR